MTWQGLQEVTGLYRQQPLVTIGSGMGWMDGEAGAAGQAADTDTQPDHSDPGCVVQ